MTQLSRRLVYHQHTSHNLDKLDPSFAKIFKGRSIPCKICVGFNDVIKPEVN